MAKKPKLLTVKEARAQVTELTGLVLRQDLRINALENELKSMTGARDNCKTMHEFNASLVDQKNADIKVLESRVQSQLTELSNSKLIEAKARRDLDVFRNETALQTIRRGFSKLGTNIGIRVKNAAARIKWWLGALNGDGTGGR